MKKKTENKGVSINALSDLTGIDRRTIKKRLAGVPTVGRAGKADLFELPIALRAIIQFQDPSTAPDIHAQQLRKIRLEADLLERKLKAADRELLPTEHVVAAWNTALITFRQVILAADITRKTAEGILENLRTIPIEEYCNEPTGDNPDTE